MKQHTIEDIIRAAGSSAVPSPDELWDEGYKIPWNEPGFSRRMLENHLTQSHDLASRRTETIAAQARRIHEFVLRERPSRILDLGCGPGLYAPYFAEKGCSYHGLDFGPASIEYAEGEFGGLSGVSFQTGDVRTADFGRGYDAVMMLYGELNVFSPDMCAGILRKAFDALEPGGKGIFEVQKRDTVQKTGQGANSWYGVQSGLFSDDPHLCLTENRWLEEPAVALQSFHVVDAADGSVSTYRSTTKAWTSAEWYDLLRGAGFVSMMTDEEWPDPAGGTMLLLGEKS